VYSIIIHRALKSCRSAHSIESDCRVCSAVPLFAAETFQLFILASRVAYGRSTMQHTCSRATEWEWGTDEEARPTSVVWEVDGAMGAPLPSGSDIE